MKRWLVVLLVLLALVILVSPGIVGRIAEKNLRENIEWAESEAGGIQFRTESFDRGWFTSEGRNRVILSNTAFSEVAENYRERTGYPELPSLVIDTRLDHGLVPITSLGRESGSLEPGLASTVSTFQLDPGNGELVPLPGALYSKVHLNGTSDSRYLLKAGDVELEGVRVEWQGADVALHTDWAGGVFTAKGGIEPLTISDGANTVHIGAMSVAADQTRSDYGFNVGTADFSIESMELESPGSRVTIGNMSFASDASIDDQRLDVATKMDIDAITVPGIGAMDFDFDLGLYRLNADSVRVVVAAFREAQASADPETALAEIFPRIEGDVQNIVSSGAEMRINQLDLKFPQGILATKLSVDIPEDDSGTDFSWSRVLLDMTATAHVRISAELYEFAKMMNPQSGSLEAMGLLRKEGDDYVMNAEYAQGLLSVNGAPMPIPMPGM